jgi:beta-glucosidase
VDKQSLLLRKVRFDRSNRFGTYTTAAALKAGLDLEMPGPTKHRGSNVELALSTRLIKPSDLTQRAKKVLDLVKHASKTKVNETEGGRDYPEDRILNRHICSNAIVLLKNDNDVLPLPKKMRKLALIGSHMKMPAISGGGSAALEPYYAVSLFDGIIQKLEDIEVAYEVGAYAHKMLPVIDTMLSSGTIMFYNEPATAGHRELVGQEEIRSTSFQLMDYTNNPKLNPDLFYATLKGQFNPDTTGFWSFGLTVCGTGDLYIDDELLIDNTTVQRRGQAFFGAGTGEVIGSKYLESGKTYELRLEFGSSKTSKLKTVGAVSFGGGGARLGACLQIDPQEAIAKAVAVAAEADYAIICTGLNVSTVEYHVLVTHE